MASSTRVLFGRFNTINNVILLVCFWAVTQFFDSTLQQPIAQRIVYRFAISIQSENQKEKTQSTFTCLLPLMVAIYGPFLFN